MMNFERVFTTHRSYNMPLDFLTLFTYVALLFYGRTLYEI